MTYSPDTLSVFHGYDRSIVAAFIEAGHKVEARRNRSNSPRVRIDGGPERTMHATMTCITRWYEGVEARAYFA